MLLSTLRLLATALALSALWMVAEPATGFSDLVCKLLLFVCSVILLHHGLTGTVPRSLNHSTWMRRLLGSMESEPSGKGGQELEAHPR